MIIRIEHLGIAVNDSDEATALFDRLLGKKSYKSERVEREGVETIFYETGESKIELLHALHADSPVSRFLDKKGPGIHHVSFLVDDIRAEMSRLKKEGFRLLSDEPKPGADNKLICFLHPSSTSGVLVEFCQEISQDQ